MRGGPALEVGTPDQPIPAKFTVNIRLVYIDGMDKQSCPAIVCCGGRMDFHGAPMSRTWVKLGATAIKGAKTVVLAEPVEGWRVGDRVIVTASKSTHKASGTPTTPKGVPIYLHDYYGPGRHAKVVSTRAKDLLGDGNQYREEQPLTGNESRVAEVKGLTFPQLLDPVDDLPPATVITHVRREGGKVVVRGTTSDNGTVVKVMVNGQAAWAVGANFGEWEATLPESANGNVRAYAEDAAGNVEKRAHAVAN